MRLLTRSDFDGLVCAVLLTEAGIADSYKFVHPKDIQDGLIDVTSEDVLANVPYVPGCGLWFDHHSSELERLKPGQREQFEGISRPAPSCARVIYEYYGGAERFNHFEEKGLMDAVDRSDSGQLLKTDVKHPEDWILLSFIMDPRTGLGRYKDYRISNYELMEKMIRLCRTQTAEEVLADPDVEERSQRYFEQEEAYEKFILENSRVDGNVLIIKLHQVGEILSGNRFKEYVLFPDVNVSVRVIWGVGQQNMVFTVGKSILKRNCKMDIGSLMHRYGGGGHRMVGTCQVPVPEWERKLQEIVDLLRSSHEGSPLKV
jgi:nanoRNase/pAp phosphatase (c-di-AMP/oligoRNAs hydrolase)